MVVEVAEMAQVPVESAAEVHEYFTHEKDNGKLDQGPGQNEPMKFGSVWGEPVKGEENNVSNANLPKDAAEEWHAFAQIYSFYFVRFRPYEDPKIKTKIDQVSEPWFLLYSFLFFGAYGQDFLDFVLEGGTFRKWWNAQRIWMIKGSSCLPFGFLEFFLQSVGISAFGFNVTSKVHDDEQSKRYDQEIFDFGVPSPMFVPLTTAAIVDFFSFLRGFLQMIGGGDREGLFLQMFISGFIMVSCWPIYEAIVFRTDKGKMPAKVTFVATFLAWNLYTAASIIFQ